MPRRRRDERSEEPLSEEEVRAFAARLAGLLESVGREVDDLESAFAQPSGGEPHVRDDESQEESAYQADAGALSMEDRLGQEVRDALDRVGEGSYGLCTSCGRAIARERLELVPYTPECTACAHEHGHDPQ